MRTIKLEIEDSKLDIVLNIIQNLKEDVVKKYEVINEDKDQKDFIEISQKSLKKIWDNEEDSIYDKYLFTSALPQRSARASASHISS